MPELATFEQMAARCEALAAENARLLEKIGELVAEKAGLQAELDARGTYAVHIVPASAPVKQVFDALEADVRDGDRVRWHGGREYVREGGIWRLQSLLQ